MFNYIWYESSSPYNTKKLAKIIPFEGLINQNITYNYKCNNNLKGEM